MGLSEPMRCGRRRTLLAPAVALAVLAVLAVPLAGCGSSGSAGANGFVVNLKQFYFQDGSFTDPGVPEPSTPAYYRVPAGKKFEFSIDYSKLGKDPNANKSGAGYLYAPGAPVAIWA